MLGYARVFLVGFLTKTPERKLSKNGCPYCNVSVGVNYRSRNKGAVVCNFFKVLFFGKSADLLERLAEKGSLIIIEGRLRINKKERDGRKFDEVYVAATTFQLFSKQKRVRKRKPLVDPVKLMNADTDEEVKTDDHM